MFTAPGSRRRFIHQTGLSIAGMSMLGNASLLYEKNQTPKESLSIREAIEMIRHLCGPEIDPTVDTVKSGDPDQPLRGVVSTFLATAEVIQKAHDLGANLIVTHEPTFYNHLDQVDYLEEDAVYRFKKKLLEQYNIVIWRFHDYWHQHRPDGILLGFLKKVGWESYELPGRENICRIPETSLEELALKLKNLLALKRTFYVGDGDLKCRHVGLLLGAWGGRSHLRVLGQEEMDVLVVGEINEWETCEYVRDAVFAGMEKGLIILGHASSEEPGMHWFVSWAKGILPSDIPVHHVPATDPFVVV